MAMKICHIFAALRLGVCPYTECIMHTIELLHSTYTHITDAFLFLSHSLFRITMRNWCALTHCFYCLTWFFLALRATFVFFFFFGLSFCLSLYGCAVCCFLTANMSLTIVQKRTPLGIECDEDNDFSFALLVRANFRFYCVWFYYIFALRTLFYITSAENCNSFAKKKQTIQSRFISV